MPLLTNPIAKGLDAKRKTLLGTSMTLVLLIHAPPTSRGYVALENGEVSSGWHLKKGGIAEVSQLTICESETVTENMLHGKDGAVAFAINGKVWKIIGADYSSPVGETFRVWKFSVTPTGEPYLG